MAATACLSRELRLCILDADHLYPQLLPSYHSYGAMFDGLLSRAAASLKIAVQISIFDVRSEQYPKSLDDYDGFLITGSKADAFADDAWIVRLRAFASQLVSEKRPTVGICFGHQLLALVIGGQVGRADKGWGVGLMTYQCAAAEAWPQPLQQGLARLATPQLQLLASHRDQVKYLPADAVPLAGNEFCPIAAFSVGEHLLCFQGHPEFSADYLLALMTLRREMVGEVNFCKAVAAQHQAHQGELVGQWLLAFLAASWSK
ncbi:amidotransferase [Corallincola luteus]|uniref:Amidotransferase n=1 Tax=Corallincola luteus TaxID=1775177 RepID=A0ABY2ARH7_9GAMM|nr:amidotransferase [Corallincola luteus]TCI05589.1 amidotransferase [Corallincola luteus]